MRSPVVGIWNLSWLSFFSMDMLFCKRVVHVSQRIDELDLPILNLHVKKLDVTFFDDGHVLL